MPTDQSPVGTDRLPLSTPHRRHPTLEMGAVYRDADETGECAPDGKCEHNGSPAVSRVVDVDSLAIEGLTEEEQRDFLDSPDVRPSAELLAERDKSRLLEWKLVAAYRQVKRWRNHLPGHLYSRMLSVLSDEQHPIQDPGSLYDWDKELVTPVRKYADMERDLAVAVAEIAAIRALHVKERGDLHDEYVDRCAHCTEICAGTILWPCPTIRSLNGDTDG